MFIIFNQIIFIKFNNQMCTSVLSNPNNAEIFTVFWKIFKKLKKKQTIKKNYKIIEN